MQCKERNRKATVHSKGLVFIGLCGKVLEEEAGGSLDSGYRGFWMSDSNFTIFNSFWTKPRMNLGLLIWHNYARSSEERRLKVESCYRVWMEMIFLPGQLGIESNGWMPEMLILSSNSTNWWTGYGRIMEKRQRQTLDFPVVIWKFWWMYRCYVERGQEEELVWKER